MLQTQVSYWVNQENKRHNLESEKLTRQQQLIDLKNAESSAIQAQAAKQNAETNVENMRTNAVNALTQIKQAEIAQGQLAVNKSSVEAAHRQAGAAERQAAASEQQAISAISQAQTAQFRADTDRYLAGYEAALKEEQRQNVSLQNSFYVPAKAVDIIKDTAGLFNTVKTGVTKLLTRK